MKIEVVAEKTNWQKLKSEYGFMAKYIKENYREAITGIN